MYIKSWLSRPTWLIAVLALSGDDGHTDVPNVKYFISWADRLIGHGP